MLAATTALAASTLMIPPTAAAAPCPDAEVVFARATTEPPGVGGVGQAFVDTLRAQAAGRSIGVYAVNYPATEDFQPSASAGAADANAHIRSMAAECANTKLVLGGYSQGALVVDLLTAVPVSIAGFVPAPLPPEAADNVAAVAVLGNPATRYVGLPLTAVSPEYGARTVDLCAQGDPICSPGGGSSTPSHDEMFSPAHLSYVSSGLAAQAATFAAGRL
ncbi:cutinase [Mycobacterium sp. E740]|nr:cutinase [Mycobacterium sp. E740]